MNIFGTSFNYEGRLDKIRKLMDEKNMDCLLVHQWVNQYYVSGFYHHLPWYPDCHSYATEAPLIVFRDKGQEPVFISMSGIYRAVMEGTWIKDVELNRFAVV
jgi:Xaa-Pro aminopeptidase